jgi:hypothetical protein
MSKDISNSVETNLGRPKALPTILLGGLAVGIFDLLFAFTYYGLFLGAKPLRIFQSVAAGLIGRPRAVEGGVSTFILGLALHFVVATCIATVYYLAARMLPVVIRKYILSGLVYGVVAYLGMNYVVIPLSAIGGSPASKRLPVLLTEIIGHALLVGLPLAVIARRSAQASGPQSPDSSNVERELSPIKI